MKTKSTNTLNTAIGVALISSSMAVPMAAFAENPFVANDIGSGYQQAAKDVEGKCGEGKAAKDAEGKCGEGKASKDAEGKCGEGKTSKDAE